MDEAKKELAREYYNLDAWLKLGEAAGIGSFVDLGVDATLDMEENLVRHIASKYDVGVDPLFDYLDHLKN